MSLLISGSDIKKNLQDTTLSLNNYICKIPPFTQSWPRAGLEAYVVPAICSSSQGSINSILKLFKMDIPERQKRINFLSSQKLREKHPKYFKAIPFISLDKRSYNNFTLCGHISERIQNKNNTAEDIFRLKNNNKWNFTLQQKINFILNLCYSIEILEDLEIVHGDISSKNVIIGEHNNQECALLCDFDGFYHKNVDKLPMSFNNQPCRPLGTIGYQYPEIIKKINENHDDIFVETDRFALLVLACEIIALDPNDFTTLNREELINDSIINKKNTDEIPTTIKKKWEQGFTLLDKALRCNSIQQMPSPFEIIEALKQGPAQNISIFGEHKLFTKPFNYTPQIEITHSTKPINMKANIKSHSGNFSKIHHDLLNLNYLFNNSSLTFKITKNQPFLLRRKSKLICLANENEINLQPNDVFIINQFVLKIKDNP